MYKRQSKISKFSFQFGSHAYLECDVDLEIFAAAMEEKFPGWKFNSEGVIGRIDTMQGSSCIRQFDKYDSQ